MSQFSPNAMAGARRKGGPNVYTLMLVIAFLALVTACAYVLVRHNTLFGNWNPFEMAKPVTGVITQLLPGLPGLGG